MRWLAHAPERGQLRLEGEQLVNLLQAADVRLPVRNLGQQPSLAEAPVQAPARAAAVQLVRVLVRLRAGISLCPAASCRTVVQLYIFGWFAMS